MTLRLGMFLVTLAILGVNPLRLGGQSYGQFIPVPGTDWAGAVNLSSRNLKAEGTLFLPEKAPATFRAVIVVMNHGETESAMLTGLNPYSAWHKVGETIGAGILHLRISSIRAFPAGPVQADVEPNRNAAAGGDEALAALMRVFAAESGHPELSDVPLLFWGWSSAAGFGPSYARLHPERTLGFIRYHSHLRGLAVDLETAQHIPALLFVGADDAADIAEDSRTLFKSGRAVGAPWSLALQPGVPHQIRGTDMTKATALAIPWITAVVRERLPRAGGRLRAVPPETGWLGNPSTGEVFPYGSYAGDKSEASWLPDEPSARAWQAVVTALP
jgi:hypothetical protein